ncbi:uncharacterized protein LOC122499958 [Leptopilina heterotoma]|uniref:uncharacterized protein LOC122499958 n=1 Tax=Leptopilina heterotoma TaxID=63436 RepID=UPI001CA9C01D|nr:uncharacterized protein LOC122499958 [Leptopilina heterotoma]
MNDCSKYSKYNYSSALAALLNLKDDLERDTTPTGLNLADTSASTSYAHPRSFLPKISLNTFSGEYTEWQAYSDLFSSLVGKNPDLTNVEKMHYLRSTLQGDASQLIASLPNSGPSFPTAWDTLVDRFENKRMLINSHLNKLLSPPVINVKSGKGLQAHLNTTNEAASALRTLGVPIDHWDIILVHLLVRNLDLASREAWELHLGSNSDYPTLDQLKTFISGRARALENIELEKGNLKPSASKTPTPRPAPVRSNSNPARIHATTTTNSTQETPRQSQPNYECDDCSELHFITTCANYKDRTPNSRAQLVQEQRLCYNCLGRHNVRSCRNPTRCRSLMENITRHFTILI